MKGLRFKNNKRKKIGQVHKRCQLEYITRNDSYKKTMLILGVISSIYILFRTPSSATCTVLVTFDLAVFLLRKLEPLFVSKIYSGKIKGYAASSSGRYSSFQKLFVWLWVGHKAMAAGRLMMLVMAYPFEMFGFSPKYTLGLLWTTDTWSYSLSFIIAILLEVIFLNLLFFKYKDFEIFKITPKKEKLIESSFAIGFVPKINLKERERQFNESIMRQNKEQQDRQKIAREKLKVSQEQIQIKETQSSSVQTTPEPVRNILKNKRDQGPNGTFTRRERSL